MNCKKVSNALFVCLALHAIGGIGAFADDDPQELLNRRVGKWATITTFKKAEWTPEERTVAGVETIEWILDKKFIQGNTVAKNDNTKSHWLMNYDKDVKLYRNWYFDNQNAFPRGESVGRWDAEAEQMNWSIDIGNGFRGKSKWQFDGMDKFKWSMTITDPNGKLMMDMRGIQTRKK